MKINITSPSFDEQELLLLKQCLDSKWVTQGAFTQQFESLFKQRHDVQYAFATTSCTAALHMAMVALDIKPDLKPRRLLLFICLV